MEDRTTALIEQIAALKHSRHAVILTHNYQLGEVQDIADFVGDSLGLSRQAAETDAEVIVFCGVHFMAETAAILSPQKTVLLPDEHSGCPMADMITADELREEKKKYPNATVVCYVNSTAAVKAECDYCCTSANSVKVINSIDNDEILFVPDQYLGHYTSLHTQKTLRLWPGYCPTHARILPHHIEEMRRQYPDATVMVHPECRPDTIAAADVALSTSGMVSYVARDDVQQVIVGTELGMIHRLRKEHPGKQFIPVSEQAICPNMKLITLEKVLWSLQELQPQITVPDDIRLKAKASIDRMLAIGR